MRGWIGMEFMVIDAWMPDPMFRPPAGERFGRGRSVRRRRALHCRHGRSRRRHPGAARRPAVGAGPGAHAAVPDGRAPAPRDRAGAAGRRHAADRQRAPAPADRQRRAARPAAGPPPLLPAGLGRVGRNPGDDGGDGPAEPAAAAGAGRDAAAGPGAAVLQTPRRKARRGLGRDAAAARLAAWRRAASVAQPQGPSGPAQARPARRRRGSAPALGQALPGLDRAPPPSRRPARQPADRAHARPPLADPLAPGAGAAADGRGRARAAPARRRVVAPVSSRSRILAQQKAWAQAAGLRIIAPGYLESVDANLRQPMQPATLAAFQAGEAAELKDFPRYPAKLRALFSSAALVVNVFDHWTTCDAAPLLAALGIEGRAERLAYEVRFPISAEGTPPNVDLAVTLAGGRCVGIESKFTEWHLPRRPARIRFKDKYFPPGQALWTDRGLPACQALAEEIQQGRTRYRYLY